MTYSAEPVRFRFEAKHTRKRRPVIHRPGTIQKAKAKVDLPSYRPPSADRTSKLLARKIRESWQWKEMRHSVLKAYPFCCSPLRYHAGNLVRVSEEVHHIIPISVDPTKALDETNTIALCRSCHRNIEKRAYRGMYLEDKCCEAKAKAKAALARGEANPWTKEEGESAGWAK